MLLTFITSISSISSSDPQHYGILYVPIDLSHTSDVLSESCFICSQMCPILPKSPSTRNKEMLLADGLKPFLPLLLLALVLKLQESLKEIRIGIPKQPLLYLLTHLYHLYSPLLQMLYKNNPLSLTFLILDKINKYINKLINLLINLLIN